MRSSKATVYFEEDVLSEELDVEPEVDIGVSTSYEVYLSSERALDDIYDKYSPFIGYLPEEESFDDFIGEKIDERIHCLENAPEDYDEKLRFSLKAMDDEASWLLTRYPQFVGGTILGIGGAGYSAMNGNLNLGSGTALGAGAFMTYTAFNGTAETIDKILTFRDSIPEQEQIWKQAREEHDLNGFASRETSPREVNHKMLHPIGANHEILYKEEGGWNEIDLAQSFPELKDKRGSKEVGKLLYYNARDIAPKYISQMGSSTLSEIYNRIPFTKR